MTKDNRFNYNFCGDCHDLLVREQVGWPTAPDWDSPVGRLIDLMIDCRSSCWCDGEVCEGHSAPKGVVVCDGCELDYRVLYCWTLVLS